MYTYFRIFLQNSRCFEERITTILWRSFIAKMCCPLVVLFRSLFIDWVIQEETMPRISRYKLNKKTATLSSFICFVIYSSLLYILIASSADCPASLKGDEVCLEYKRVFIRFLSSKYISKRLSTLFSMSSTCNKIDKRFISLGYPVSFLLLWFTVRSTLTILEARLCLDS